MFWTAKNIKTIILDFLQQVAPDARKISSKQFEEGNDFYQDFGISSMQLVELASAINAFFHLFNVDQPPNLLKYPLLDSWVQKILEVRSEYDERLSFKSSGTTGSPRLITHQLDSINHEISFLQSIIKQPKRIISFVPSNHIYGFLFTVVLPQKWNIPVYKASQVKSLVFNEDDLIIATPFNWHFLGQSFNQQKINCNGVSSGAPLDNLLYKNLTEIGYNITEVYGSSETAGVGYRVAAAGPFKLFPYWSFMQGNKLKRKYDQQEFELLDNVTIHSDQFFSIDSRIDSVVQVGGINVNLDKVKEKIEAIAVVKKANIFAKGGMAGTTITASILLETNTDQMQQLCVDQIYKALELFEVPKHILFLDK